MIIFDKDLKVFAKVLSKCREGGFVCEPVADENGYKIKQANFVASETSVIPYQVVIKEQIKNHEKAIKNLHNLEKLEEELLLKKIKKLADDYLKGRVKEYTDYDFEEWSGPMSHYCKELLCIKQ